jgi:hypothetical protein
MLYLNLYKLVKVGGSSSASGVSGVGGHPFASWVHVGTTDLAILICTYLYVLKGYGRHHPVRWC